MYEWVIVDEGELKISSIEWIGPVRGVKVTSGKGKDMVERMVFNFFMKSGFNTYKSVDYTTEENANRQRMNLKKGVN